MKKINNSGLPNHFVFVFVIVVLALQLAYLVLVRPTPGDPSHALDTKIINNGVVMRSPTTRYRPTKLNALIDHRKDYTNSITLVFVEVGSLQLAQNLLLEFTKFNILNYVVFSLDNYTTCEKLDDGHCYFDESYDFSDENNRLAYRINITTFLVQQGFNVFVTHKDVLLSDNPLLYFDRTVDINVLLEFPTSVKKAKENPEDCCDEEPFYDVGFYFVRSTPPSISFLEDYWKTFISTNMSVDEAFNIAITKNLRNMKIKTLSNVQFSNGFSAFWMGQMVDPVAIHANWADLDTKIYRARELMHWNLDQEERYSAPRKYVTYSTEDDTITFEVEKDHLLLAYMIAKLLDRNLILPKFHCYIDKPPTCLLDALFDTQFTKELDVYENALLTTPKVPPSHLRRAKLAFPEIDTNVKISTMKELQFQLRGFEDVPLLEIQFPKVARDGKHYSLNGIPDRKGRWDHEIWAKQVEKAISFSNQTLENWNSFLPPSINSEEADFVCVVTVSEELDLLVSTIQSMKQKKPLYIISNNPTQANLPNIYNLKWKLSNEIVFGYDELWDGHKLMKGHSALAHLQMQTCMRASDVIVNAFGPDWLTGGICSGRRNLKKSNCNKLLKDPWESQDSAKIEYVVPQPLPPKEKEEREKIEKYRHGVLAIYPERGPAGGGNTVTFMHSPENASNHFTSANYGGCKFDGELVPHFGVTKYMDAFYLVHCYAPAHKEGTVDAVLVVEGEERAAFPGTIMYTYISQESFDHQPNPYIAVCTVFKNQAHYTREWVAFHHMLGVNKFYMYDQGSEENWQATVKDYIDKGIVEIYAWDLFLKPSTRMQTAALWHCIKNHPEISWLMLTDLDEFTFPVQKRKDRNLTNILREFDETDIAQIYVDRVNYGPSGHDERPKGLVTESYYLREPFTYSPVKSFVKPKFIVDTVCGGVHTFKVADGKDSTDIRKEHRKEDCGRSYEPALDRIRINHYWSKSVEDFNQKLRWDGNPYQVSADDLLAKWTNVVEDRVVEAYMFDLKRKIKQKV